MDYIPTSRINNLLIGDDVDTFWVDLGIETSNLIKWNSYCWVILEYCLGKNKTKSLLTIDKHFCRLQSLLDDLVCISYPRSIFSIQVNNQDVRITHIFYSNDDIIICPFEKNKKKTITQQDKNYIIKCIEQTNIYLNYLENNIDKLPVNIENFKNYPKIIKSIREEIQKISFHKMSSLLNMCIVDEL